MIEGRPQRLAGGRTVKRASVLLLSLVLGAGAAHALAPGDGVVVLYNDGSKVSGVLVERTSAQVTIDSSGARLTSNMADVRSVTAKTTALRRFEELLKAAGSDPKKLRAAADFARAHRLHTEYARLAERLGLPPDAVEAPAEIDDVPAAPPADEPADRGQQPPPIDAAIQGAPPLPTLGYASSAVPDPSAGDFVAGPPPQRERRRGDDEKFLNKQAAEREARTHEATTPVSDMQFRLQQALDRSARGLPVGAP
jgi:hypothetical protein